MQNSKSRFQSVCKWQVYLVKHQGKPLYANNPSAWAFRILVQTEAERWGTEQHCGVSRSCSRKFSPESEPIRSQKMLGAASVCPTLGVNPCLAGWIMHLMATEKLWKEKFIFTQYISSQRTLNHTAQTLHKQQNWNAATSGMKGGSQLACVTRTKIREVTIFGQGHQGKPLYCKSAFKTSKCSFTLNSDCG